MPLLEVLPSSTQTSAPGWAYVPDTGLDPVKAGHIPQNPRKRTAGRHGAAVGPGIDLSARQQAAFQKRLAELDRDNARDVTIAIPSRAKEREGGPKAPKGKTPATRRILLAQKTFANYLADEEALAAQQLGDTGTPAPIAASSPALGSSPAPSSARGKGTPTAVAGLKRKAAGPPKKEKEKENAQGTASSPPQTPAPPPPAPPTPAAAPPPPQPPPSSSPPSTNAPPASANPFAQEEPPAPPPVYIPPPPPPMPPLSPRSEKLMRTNTPTAPSAVLIHALTHAPPLPFHAARAPAPGSAGGHGPLAIGKETQKKPRRRFCVTCGRWGKNRCVGCGESVCGLDCARAHGDGCVGLGGIRR